MREDPKWYALAILGLVFIAIFVLRAFSLREYTDQEIHDICMDTYVQYTELAERSATVTEWTAFENSTLPKLESIAKEIERYPQSDAFVAWTYYQTVKHGLPTLIQSRGKASSDFGIGQVLAARSTLGEPLPEPSPDPESSQTLDLRAGETDRGDWDPVIVAILLCDTVVVLGGVGYWFWRKQ